MIKVGITGGIGSGKTTVVNFFKELGIPAYIADDKAKQLMHESPLKEALIRLFGSDSFDEDGRLNREFIAARVFKNQELLKKLNALVHPSVEADFQAWASRQSSAYIIYEAAILFETGKYKNFDYNILITAPESTRIARILKRDRTSEQEIRRRMDNQWPDQRKEKLADWVIINEELADTEQEVLRLHNILSRN